MTTINYDRHITDLVDALSRTGHVTHNKYKKKSITFHHNGGLRFSHQTILNIWRTRPASAHFDVDADAKLAQYVNALEYAWAVGNTEGNVETISIEMANISVAPHWAVDEDTLRAAARLAGWLFAHVIKARPTRNNVFVHKHWSQTSCAGPFVDANFDRLLRMTQTFYFHFTDAPNLTKVQRIQIALEVDADNKWGAFTDSRAMTMRNASRAHAGRPSNVVRDFDVRVAQRVIDTDPDGVWGRLSQTALYAWIKSFQHILGVGVTGYWDKETDDAFLTIRKNRLIS